MSFKDSIKKISYAGVIGSLQDSPVKKLSDTTGPIGKIVLWIATIFWILAVASVIWAAFTFLTAGGDESKVGEAKKQLIYALIAAAVALLANGINMIAANLLGA
jgi:hypothetical protein